MTPDPIEIALRVARGVVGDVDLRIGFGRAQPALDGVVGELADRCLRFALKESLTEEEWVAVFGRG